MGEIWGPYGGIWGIRAATGEHQTTQAREVRVETGLMPCWGSSRSPILGEVRARSGVARSGPPWKIPQVVAPTSCSSLRRHSGSGERTLPVWRGTAVTAAAMVDTYAQTHIARSGLTAPHNTHSCVFKSSLSHSLSSSSGVFVIANCPLGSLIRQGNSQAVHSGVSGASAAFDRSERRKVGVDARHQAA